MTCPWVKKSLFVLCPLCDYVCVYVCVCFLKLMLLGIKAVAVCVFDKSLLELGREDIPMNNGNVFLLLTPSLCLVDDNLRQTIYFSYLIKGCLFKVSFAPWGHNDNTCLRGLFKGLNKKHIRNLAKCMVCT